MDLLELSPLLKYGETYLAESCNTFRPELLEARRLRDSCVDELKMEGVLKKGKIYSNETIPGMELKLEDFMLFATMKRDGEQCKMLLCAEKACQLHPDRLSTLCRNDNSIRRVRADISFRNQGCEVRDEEGRQKLQQTGFSLNPSKRLALQSYNNPSTSAVIKKVKK